MSISDAGIEAIATEVDDLGIPEVSDIQYDLWTLRITCSFEEKTEPVYVDFDSNVGFRVLDERDMPIAWKTQNKEKAWLYSVTQGGWLDQEKSRPGFTSGTDEKLKEFMIVGIDDCVSVLAYEPPKIKIL